MSWIDSSNIMASRRTALSDENLQEEFDRLWDENVLWVPKVEGESRVGRMRLLMRQLKLASQLKNLDDVPTVRITLPSLQELDSRITHLKGSIEDYRRESERLEYELKKSKEELARLERKVAHGCTDAHCPECDGDGND